VKKIMVKLLEHVRGQEQEQQSRLGLVEVLKGEASE
jgi:hypothetical protein